MASRFSLDGNIIPRKVKRLFDQRMEPRIESEGQTARFCFRGRDYVVGLLNYSESGAMVLFDQVPHIGEAVTISLPGRAPVPGRVNWFRDGKIGLTLANGVE